MASPSEPATVCEALESALTGTFGHPVDVTDLQRLSGGASRETWSFGVEGRRLILRRDPPGRPGPPRAMHNEADVLRACHRAGLAVPEVVFEAAGGELGTDGFVMDRVDGETIPRRILRDDTYAKAREVLGEQVAGFLAGLHAIDPGEVPGVAAADDVATYRAAYDFISDTSPTFERTFEWLEANRPSSSGKVLVHGDLRMGNIIVDEGGLAAVIDWELMHLGDPVEDLAWFCVRAWRFGSTLGAGGVADIEEFLGAYETAAGRRVDRDVFGWWLVAKTLAWGVISMGQAQAHLSGAVRSHELAAVGRRVAETEWDLVELLAPEAAAAAAAEAGDDAASDDPGIWGRPTMRELLDAVRGFLETDVSEATTGRVAYGTRVAANMLGIVERQLAVADRDVPSYGGEGPDAVPSWESIARVVHTKLAVANPRYLTAGHVG